MCDCKKCVFNNFYTACDDLREVFNSVETLSSQWELLALQLGLKSSTRDKIKAGRGLYFMACLMDVLDQWLNLDYDIKKLGRPSWKLLAQSVEKLDPRLFQELTKRHNTS